jgi:hypothetical protein
MNSNTKTDYHATILVYSTPSEAFQGICRVGDWWTVNFSGNAEKKGDEFFVPFGETSAQFVVTEIIPGKKIKWHVLDCNLHFLKNKKEWKGTDILWEIRALKDATEIQMTHIGLKPGIECFEDCTRGWNHYVKGSLAGLLNEGKGVPDHPDYSARDRQ